MKDNLPETDYSFFDYVTCLAYSYIIFLCIISVFAVPYYFYGKMQENIPFMLGFIFIPPLFTSWMFTFSGAPNFSISFVEFIKLNKTIINVSAFLVIVFIVM